jgi:hypothetical protein
MFESILLSIKKILGLDPDYTVFDMDLITHINSVFATLNELGIGPDEGFEIVDETTVWNDYLEGDKRFSSVKTYMYLRVRLLFDPPTMSYLITALKEQIEELEWRINVVREVQDYPLEFVEPVEPVGGRF